MEVGIASETAKQMKEQPIFELTIGYDSYAYTKQEIEAHEEMSQEKSRYPDAPEKPSAGVLGGSNVKVKMDDGRKYDPNKVSKVLDNPIPKEEGQVSVIAYEGEVFGIECKESKDGRCIEYEIY